MNFFLERIKMVAGMFLDYRPIFSDPNVYLQVHSGRRNALLEDTSHVEIVYTDKDRVECILDINEQDSCLVSILFDDDMEEKYIVSADCMVHDTNMTCKSGRLQYEEILQ